MHYAISGGLLDQDGVGLGSGFRRNSVRGNFDTQVNDWLQLGASAYYAYTKQIVTFEESNVIQTALVQYPDVAPYNADGTLSLAIHPASTIFGLFTPEQCAEMSVPDTTVRLSIGLEDKSDLLEDIKQALRIKL